MFTGIVSETGIIRSVKPMEGGQELEVACSFAADAHVDESIAVNGVCLTVVSFDDEAFRVQCVQETLRKTSLGALHKGMSVNLERSMTMDKAIEGHIVQGHVDTVGRVERITKAGADLLVEISYPIAYEDYVVDRGSIAVDGISLTVARTKGGKNSGDAGDAGDAGVDAAGSSPRFTVAIIPYTWDFTNLKDKKEGDSVNLEFDMFGKYIINYLKKRGM